MQRGLGFTSAGCCRLLDRTQCLLLAFRDPRCWPRGPRGVRTSWLSLSCKGTSIERVGEAVHEAAEEDDVALLVRDAEEGIVEAQYILGKGMCDEESQEGEKRWAAHWLGKAAEQGDARAQHELGLLALHGRGVPKDPQAAAAWVSAAANQGLPAAQLQMGLMLLEGNGVQFNPEWARYWLERAAEQDAPSAAAAQYRLGMMYQEGQGGEASRERALFWFERSAERGNQAALVASQAILRKGPGPPAPGNTPGLPANIRRQLWGKPW